MAHLGLLHPLLLPAHLVVAADQQVALEGLEEVRATSTGYTTVWARGVWVRGIRQAHMWPQCNTRKYEFLHQTLLHP